MNQAPQRGVFSPNHCSILISLWFFPGGSFRYCKREKQEEDSGTFQHVTEELSEDAHIRDIHASFEPMEGGIHYRCSSYPKMESVAWEKWGE